MHWLTARSALEKSSAVQMIDAHPPTTGRRETLLTRLRPAGA